MALFHNRNYSARFEKEEMALFHNRVKEIRSMVMAEEFRRLLECISPFEIEKKGLSNLKALINIQLETLDTWSLGKTKNDVFKEATTKAEATNEKSRDEIKLCKYREVLNFAVACDKVLYCIFFSKESRMKLFIVLLAVLLLGNKNDCKLLARPERGKISCITVYLLGNDGAHSYNGNGIRFTKTIKYVRLTDDELVDQLGHGKPPMDVRLREPTDREIAKIARKIGREYVSLAPLLGFTKAELDHFREDHRFTEHRVFEMLFKWRETKESNATIEKLADALEELGINADIIYSSLD